MKTIFKTTSVDGEEFVMDTTKLDIKEIRFNRNSRQITIVQNEPKPVAKAAPKPVAKKVVAKVVAKAPAKKVVKKAKKK